MRGVEKNDIWLDEPITEVQAEIVRTLGFAAPEKWEPDSWNCGAFDRDEIDIVIRHLPFLPKINEILKSVGFRWDSANKEWYGRDKTKLQIEVLQAISYCSRRYYRDCEVPSFAKDCAGLGMICPVRVGAYA